MESEVDFKKCQLHCLPQMAQPLTAYNVIGQRKNRIHRILKRRWIYLKNWFTELSTARTSAQEARAQSLTNEGLQAGDRVRVLSKEEIQTTLNRWNQLKGCAFMEEMGPYCGTTQRVFKRVEKFLDERDYLVKKCNGVVILDGVMCQGTKDFGPCDRSCFFFWREEWLERID